jgi:hypothetical protein
MRLLSKTALAQAVLAGGAALAVAAATLPAGAQHPQPRMATLMLPDGRLVQVQYVTDAVQDVRPQPSPLFSGTPRPERTFAALDRVSAMMQRQADVMLREAARFSALPAMGIMPASGEFYSVSTSTSASGGCTQSTEISYGGGGLKPRVVSSMSGNCGQRHAAPMYQLGPNQGDGRAIRTSSEDAYKQMIKPAVLLSR